MNDSFDERWVVGNADDFAHEWSESFGDGGAAVVGFFPVALETMTTAFSASWREWPSRPRSASSMRAPFSAVSARLVQGTTSVFVRSIIARQFAARSLFPESMMTIR